MILERDVVRLEAGEPDMRDEFLLAEVPALLALLYLEAALGAIGHDGLGDGFDSFPFFFFCIEKPVAAGSFY
jgi:hypothetical protein